MNLTWSSRKKKQVAADRAAPVENPGGAFTVPNYDVGGPYVVAAPNYTSNPGVTDPHTPHDWQSVGEQFSQFRRYGGTYPEAGEPPEEWSGYYHESWQRSEKQENVINAAEGFPNPQRFLQWALNPYWYRNDVNRPQRTPHEYSFVRAFDKGVLGKRQLTGDHGSEATIGMSSAPLKGMSVPSRRRSTYRIDPIQYSVATVDDSIENPPFSTTFTSPEADFGSRSYRLS
jgi:hypothetical protein